MPLAERGQVRLVGHIVSRPAETRAVAEFLTAATTEPSALVVEGEPGIGKTTLWQAGVELAKERGFKVLCARAAAAESVLAYAALADMLSDIDSDVCGELPSPQRLAIDRVLLRAGADDRVTDLRAVAAGFLSLVERLAEATPVLLALDDLQWLDSSSMRIVAFTARRLSGRTGIIATVRTEPGAEDAASWLQLPGSESTRRIRLGPLGFGGLRTMIDERLDMPLSRATLVRIYEISRGNPLYALELAKGLVDQATKSDAHLSASLRELVRTRIGSLDDEVRAVLLAAACASAPTVELVARATGNDTERAVGLLAIAEGKGIVRIDGCRLSFTHPLLARGVYSEATAAQRRKVHRSLAEVVEETELQARHLAMAVAWADAHTLECLDRAAEMARARGAPAAAAELLDLAVGLGGDTAERQIRLAQNHFEAGDTARARALLEETIAALEPGRLRAGALSLLGPVHIFGDSFVEGVAAMERSLEEATDDLALRVATLVALLLALFNSGQLDAAARRADDAVADAERLGDPLLLSQALSLRVVLGFLRGDGLDQHRLQLALEMADRDTDTAGRSGFQVIVHPRSHHAILLSWAGQLDRAHDEFVSLRESCIEHGLETELIYVTSYQVQAEIWRGNFAEARRLTEQAVESALQIGGKLGLGAALTCSAAIASYAGDEEQVRRDVSGARTALRQCGAYMLEGLPIAIEGFLEVSAGYYEKALATLQPLLAYVREAPDGTEIYIAEFVPDAVEAMVHLGCLDEAEPLVEALERNGRRLDRPWMLAVGARCRSMLLAARGNLDAATAASEMAMIEHQRLPMPFERARTRVLLGQIQRRQRRREAARRTLREALAAFEAMGIPLWADRARFELARATIRPAGTTRLTESEGRVAELAASGMTNRDVAAALFISPKTVEANLARVYHKLGIHSRAELGRLIGRTDDQGISDVSS